MKITKRKLRRIIKESLLLEQSVDPIDEIIEWAKAGNKVLVSGRVAYPGIKPIAGPIDHDQEIADQYTKLGPAFEKMLHTLSGNVKITLQHYRFKQSGSRMISASGGSWKNHKTMTLSDTQR